MSRALVVGGWVIPKTTLMPDHDQFWWTPYAQLRPDRPVMARRSVHRHDGMAHRHRDDGRCQCGEFHTRPPVRRSRWPYRPQDAWWDWYQPPLGKKARARHETSVCDWAADGLSLPVDILDARDGEVLVPTGHLHPDTGEVVLPARGRHAHLTWAKYLYVPGQGKAQRLNTHPRVRSSGYAAPEGVFFFVIEGTLKLDAVVSAGWPGIESGSVTLWGAYAEEAEAEWVTGDFGEVYLDGGMAGYSELEEFALRYLQGVPTAVVCDSDWVENRLVRDQVNQAVALLAGCGVPAVGCAPPAGEYRGWTHPFTGQPVHAKLGVDDYLAQFHPKQWHDALLDLRVRDPKADPPGLEAAVMRAAEKKAGEEIHRGLLRELARDSTSGLVEYRPAVLGRRLNRDTANVDRARDKHLALGHITEVVAAEKVSNGYGEVRTLAPVYRLREDLRPREHDRTLRDWLTGVSS